MFDKGTEGKMLCKGPLDMFIKKRPVMLCLKKV